jgi:cyclopropane fatty-acyl-phospholipid synthase-like methyltransferase
LRDYINFYKEIHGREKIQNNYREAIDETDQAFYDAFSSDYGIIARAFNMKR